ncbi:MAG: bifunctional diaminohydroxyphosphoribosylaminopyrimidine deaminase/5-amino-6-(5-phosphoribosylamino)uracil reductase RibD [Oscillospiraceae bacterium]
MKYAIELAKKGTGFVNPNPLVGAVIVKNGKIIGEGYHEKYGQLHAERNAFANCAECPENADLYVTLEPCCHYGKTPPCTEAVIENKIKRVFIGSADPNPLVAGKGIEMLRSHGIEVHENILRDECDSLNEIFFHYITHKTPFVIMKYAMTADGKIATVTGESKWITSEKSREHVHHIRKRVAAIMVGIGTVLADNPTLDCRIENPVNPIRIICDSSIKIPLDCNIVNTADKIPTYIAHIMDNPDKMKILAEKNIRFIKTSSENGHVNLKELMSILGKMKIDSVLIEGGAEINFNALKSGIVSQIYAYIAPKIFGGNSAKTPVGSVGFEKISECIMLEKPEIIPLGDDLLIKYNLKG